MIRLFHAVKFAMRSKIIDKICNEVEDAAYRNFDSVPKYIESTLNADKELYKYISLEKDAGFVENIIRKNTIKYGAPNAYNDPFECMSIIGVGSLSWVKEQLNKSSGKNYSDGAILRAYDEIVGHSLKNYRESELAKYGLLCLSGVWDNILMWSHYANDHKGLVIVFQFDSNHTFYEKLRKVEYIKGITYFELDHENCGKKIWESFSTKDPIWEYENEYRVINVPSHPAEFNGSGIKSFPRELLKGLIFGWRMSKDVRNNLIEMRNKYYPTLELWDIVLNDDKIGLFKASIE